MERNTGLEKAGGVYIFTGDIVGFSLWVFLVFCGKIVLVVPSLWSKEFSCVFRGLVFLYIFFRGYRYNIITDCHVMTTTLFPCDMVCCVRHIQALAPGSDHGNNAFPRVQSFV